MDLTREVQINKSNEFTDFSKSDMIIFGGGLGENWKKMIRKVGGDQVENDILHHSYFP